MSKIQNKFNELKSKKEKALIAYLMFGFPNERDFLLALRGLIKGGADIIEIGFPFSDPIADGPIIQMASHTSLKKGITIEKFFKMLKKIRKETKIPLVLMTYTNILYKKGYKNFLSTISKLGIDGIILPDMSIEESKQYLVEAKKNNLDTIFLISPNTDKERIKKISKAGSGFMYLVSVYGTTGIQSKIKKYSVEALKNTKKILNSKIPLGVGFGISKPQDAKRFVQAGADGIIVGSAIIKLIDKTPSNKITKKVEKFTRSIKNVTQY